MRSYDNDWDGELDGWHGPFDWSSTTAWFKALQRRHIQHDIVYLSDALTVEDLLPYPLIVAGHFTVMTEAAATLLEEYARRGGVVIFGCRTGYKDSRGHCRMTPIPGPVAKLCGIIVDDYTMISPTEETPTLTGPLFKRRTKRPALAFNEILCPIGVTTTILAKYQGASYAGKPALTRNAVGAGAAYYYGAVFDVELAEALIDHIGLRHPGVDWLTVPDDVELVVREDGSNGRRMYFLLNYTPQTQEIALGRPVTDLLTGAVVSGSIGMSPYGVMILDATL